MTGLRALRPIAIRFAPNSISSRINPMMSSHLQRRLLNVICCVIGCAVLAGVGFQIWRTVHAQRAPDTGAQAGSGGTEEQENIPPAPLTDPKKLVDPDQPEPADRDSAFRLTGLAAPAE